MVKKSARQHVFHQTCVDPKQNFVVIVFIVAEVHSLSQLLTDSSLRLNVLGKRISLRVVEKQRKAKVSNLFVGGIAAVVV